VFSASFVDHPGVAAEETSSIAFVLALSKALHRYGTPAHRLEEAVNVICTRLDLECEVFTTPTAIIMSFGAPTELRTRMLRIDGGELDMDKLEQVDDLADDVASQEISAAEGVSKLEAILPQPRRYGRALSTLAHAFTSGGLAVSFGGTIIDVALASAIGLLLGLLAQVAKRSTDHLRVFELLGAAFVSFAAAMMSSVVATTPSLVTVAALIVLLPGLSLTVAMTELATRHLIAGTARLMSAVIVLLELVIGVAFGDRVARALVDVHQAVPIALPSWAQWLALIAASLGIAVVVQAQQRAFLWILAACSVGYVGSALGSTWLDPQLGVVVGAFAVGVLGNVFARLMERPAQVVQVPAMLLLVPGSMGFRGMASLLGHDTLSGVETVFAMFVVAFAIVAGLLIANAVVSPRRSL
jgi:uncharacterized membrane protein YjjP (DUF1212 family)